MYSTEYVKHLRNGPFPGRIDLWAEAGRYFQQIHSGMIENFLSQIQEPLMEMGYWAGKEVSLQVMEGRQPDVFVQNSTLKTEKLREWDYATAAAEILAEPGVIAESSVELQAIHVKEFESGDLVTIVEIVSPRNKTEPDEIAQYQDRRGRLLINQGVNVVEIDPTRSVKRLLNHDVTASHAYHTAVYLPGAWPRVIFNDVDEPLKRLALPLRVEVVPMELQQAYDHAYQIAAIANQILDNERYTEQDLPFPSLLTDEQCKTALRVVTRWRDELTKLKPG
jgi:Protein of unknown function (DUF4058)